jgi:hypothetical protein
MEMHLFFGVSHAANSALREHRSEQNRVARETRLPLRHFGMTASQHSHFRLAIRRKRRQVDVSVSQGQSIAEAIRQVGIS